MSKQDKMAEQLRDKGASKRDAGQMKAKQHEAGQQLGGCGCAVVVVFADGGVARSGCDKHKVWIGPFPFDTWAEE